MGHPIKLVLLSNQVHSSPVKADLQLRVKSKVKIELIKYISKKGSVAINGVSLTVNSVNKNLFSVNIISHTLKNTTLSFLDLNNKVNIEVDTIARYAVNAAECYIKEK